MVANPKDRRNDSKDHRNNSKDRRNDNSKDRRNDSKDRTNDSKDRKNDGGNKKEEQSEAEAEDISSEEEEENEDGNDSPQQSKGGASLEVSGKLAEDEVKGSEIKYTEPPEARVPKVKWRLYPFKGLSNNSDFGGGNNKLNEMSSQHSKLRNPIN